MIHYLSLACNRLKKTYQKLEVIKLALPNFEENLQKYAQLLVAKGINVQPGDWVKMTITVDQAPLARLITKEAYQLGAEKVIIKWSDDGNYQVV